LSTKEKNDLSMRLTNTIKDQASSRENTFPDESLNIKEQPKELERESNNIPSKMSRDNGIEPTGSSRNPPTDNIFSNQDKIYIPSTTEPIQQAPQPSPKLIERIERIIAPPLDRYSPTAKKTGKIILYS
jgi:hypothetical protein